MRKFLWLIIPFAICAIFNTHAYASEVIQNYNVTAVINKDGTVNIKEQIDYDFGSASKHGIYRNIKYKKTNEEDKKFKLKIDNIRVSDENNRPYTFAVSTDSDYVNIKIGDADKFVTGPKTYIIEYKVSGALTYFSDHDEFYWNATGDEWDVRIVKSSAQITLPQEVTQPETVCYTGSQGSTTQYCEIITSNNVVTVTATSWLLSNEGLTVAVKFPKGIVSILEPQEDKPGILATIISYLVGITVALAGLFWYVVLPIKIFLKWFKDKRNTKIKERIATAWFSSPKTLNKRLLSPAETGALVDKDVDHKDISATIIDVAQRGFIKIIVPKKNQVFFEKKKDFGTLAENELNLMEGIFRGKEEVNLKDLQTSVKFGKALEKFKTDTSVKLVNEGLFLDQLDKVLTKYNIIAVFAGLTANFHLMLISLLLGRKAARRTNLGIEKYSEAMALKNFLVSQDEKLNFQAQNQMFFEKLLPYATAFGVEKIWAKHFEDLQFKQPDWCEGDINNSMFFYVMAHNIRSASAASITTTPTHSSSGFGSGFSGGFSGGGGGGGGGGSW